MNIASLTHVITNVIVANILLLIALNVNYIERIFQFVLVKLIFFLLLMVVVSNVNQIIILIHLLNLAKNVIKNVKNALRIVINVPNALRV